MRYYETLYLINPNLGDDDYRDVVAKFNNLIEKNKGMVLKVDEWGNRPLAYEVKKFNKGYYVLLQYGGQPGISAELQRGLKLDDRVLNYQTIKLQDTVPAETVKGQEEVPRKEADDVQLEQNQTSLNQEAPVENRQEDENALQ